MEKKIIRRKLRKDRLFLLVLGICCFIGGIYFFFQQLKPTPTPSTVIYEHKNEPQPPLVVIDPGHGGYDGGTLSLDESIAEKDITMEISTKLKNILNYYGVEVVLTRESDDVSWSNDNEEDLFARLDIAKQNEAKLLVSIHCNAAEFDFEEISGIEVYANPEQSESMKLAQDIQNHLSDTELNVREMKDGSVYHLMIFNEDLPVALVETGFLTNSYDLAHLTSDYGQSDVALEIAYGILDYLGIEIEK